MSCSAFCSLLNECKLNKAAIARREWECCHNNILQWARSQRAMDARGALLAMIMFVYSCDLTHAFCFCCWCFSLFYFSVFLLFFFCSFLFRISLSSRLLFPAKNHKTTKMCLQSESIFMLRFALDDNKKVHMQNCTQYLHLTGKNRTHIHSNGRPTWNGKVFFQPSFVILYNVYNLNLVKKRLK